MSTLVVLHTGPFTSTLDIVPEASRFPLPEKGYALQTRAGIEDGLLITLLVCKTRK